MKVFYHKNCIDGIASAAVIDYWMRNKLKDNLPTVEFTGLSPAQDIPINDIEEGEEVYIVDLSPNSIKELETIREKAGCVIWIDHHKSTIEKFKNIISEDAPIDNKCPLQCWLTDERCGAYLTWEFLIGNLNLNNDNISLAIKYIDDYDRFAGKYEFSDAFRSGLMLYSGGSPTNSNVWDKLLRKSITMTQKVLDAGQIIEANTEMWRRKSKGYTLDFEGLKFLVMNKFGNSKAFKYIDDGTYDGLMLWTFNGDSYVYSLYRGKLGEKNNIDMSEIATKYGGGGHPGAAGFSSKKFYANPNI